MPKRASADDVIDPVRSRLAAAAAASSAVPSARPPAPVPTPAMQEERHAAAVEPRRVRTGREAGGLLRGGALTTNRKVLVTAQEAEQIEQTAGLISAAFGSKVTYSQISRAVWSILAGAEDAIKASAKRAPNLSAPSKGDHLGMAEYERELADFLITALKRS